MKGVDARRATHIELLCSNHGMNERHIVPIDSLGITVNANGSALIRSANNNFSLLTDINDEQLKYVAEVLKSRTIPAYR